jgi:hypothetical protein
MIDFPNRLQSVWGCTLCSLFPSDNTRFLHLGPLSNQSTQQLHTPYDCNATHRKPLHPHNLSLPRQTTITDAFLALTRSMFPLQSLTGMAKQVSAMVSCQCLCFLSNVCSDIYCQKHILSSAKNGIHLHSLDLSASLDSYCNKRTVNENCMLSNLMNIQLMNFCHMTIMSRFLSSACDNV